MPNQHNIQMVEFYSDKFQKASAVYFTDYLGLVIKEFKKDHDLPEMKAFVFDGKVMDKASFHAVSNLPSQEILLTKLVNGLSSPMTKLASTLNGAMSDFANVLTNLKKSKTE